MRKMNLLFFVFTYAIGGVLISAASSAIFIFNFINAKYSWIGFLKEQNFFQKLLENFNLHDQVEDLAEEKLNNLVRNFKTKVPMVGMFLTGELETTLKQLAKEELLSMVPEIKNNLLTGIDQSSIYTNVEEQLAKINTAKIYAILFRLLIPSLLTGGILGALFGLIIFFFRPY